MREKHLFKHFQVIGRFTLPFPHSFPLRIDRACMVFGKPCSTILASPTLSPCVSLTPFDLGTELTANPISKCVPLCRPTWVHSVIPVTRAPFHAGLPLTDFSASCTRWIILTDFRFTTVFPKSKPPGSTELPRRRAYGHIYVSHTHTSMHPPTLHPNSHFYPTRYLGNRRKWYSTHLCVGAFPSVSPVLALATRAV